MYTTSHAKVADALYLVQMTPPAPGNPVIAAPPAPIHHVAVIDCSGSMTGDLQKLRDQMKKRLPTLLAESDLISIVWFSGRGQCGTVCEMQKVAGPNDLENVKKVIDRWIVPVGMTAFVGPMKLAQKLVADCKTAYPAMRQSLFFMSDGMDNQSALTEILDSVRPLRDVDAATIVQYGYYADESLLSQIAAITGGRHVFAEDFNAYEPIFANAIYLREKAPKRAVKLPTVACDDGLAFVCSGGNISLANAFTRGHQEEHNIAAGEGTIVYLSFSAPEGSNETATVDAVYAAISVYARQMNIDRVDQLLATLKDPSFTAQADGLFGKQAFAAFADRALAATFDVGLQFVQGRGDKAKPVSMTVLDVMELLQEDEHSALLLDHPLFSYSKIGRGRESVEGEEGISPLVFTADKKADGYPVLDLTWNTTRANISLLVRKTGTVDLSGRIPEGPVPHTFPTFIFRNFTIVKDGLLNVDVLPVHCSKETFAKIKDAGIPISEEYTPWHDWKDGHGNAIVRLRGVPILNRAQVKNVLGQDLAALAFQLQLSRCKQKVFNAFKKEAGERRSDDFDAKYGKEASSWLKDHGITSYGGFAPETKSADPNGDFYMAKVLKVSVDGLMTLPSVKDVQKAIDTKKALRGAGNVMAEHIRQVNTADSKLQASFIQLEAEHATKQTRFLLRSLARKVFTFIVSRRGGFADLPLWDGLTNKSFVVNVGDVDVDVTVETLEQKVLL